MTKKIKKQTISLVTALMCATSSMGVISASAATSGSFSVKHVNYYGAPSSESVMNYVTVEHRAAGARATVSSCSNSDGSGVAGDTNFDCDTYRDMVRVVVNGMDSKDLKPSMGNPHSDISVTYVVSAHSNRSSNTYSSSGSIKKIS